MIFSQYIVYDFFNFYLYVSNKLVYASFNVQNNTNRIGSATNAYKMTAVQYETIKEMHLFHIRSDVHLHVVFLHYISCCTYVHALVIILSSL